MSGLSNAPRSRPASQLLFSVGDMRCCLELTRLHRIAPWASLDPPDDPELLGWLLLEGERVPVVDLAQMVMGTETPRHMASRILVLPCDQPGGGTRLVGALAGDVLSLMQPDETDGVERFDPCEMFSALMKRLA